MSSNLVITSQLSWTVDYHGTSVNYYYISQNGRVSQAKIEDRLELLYDIHIYMLNLFFFCGRNSCLVYLLWSKVLWWSNRYHHLLYISVTECFYTLIRNAQRLVYYNVVIQRLHMTCQLKLIL